MAGISSPCYYWLLSLLLLYGAKGAQSDEDSVTCEIMPIGNFTTGDTDFAEVECTTDNSDITEEDYMYYHYGGQDHTHVSILLSCVAFLNEYVNVTKLEKCVDVFQDSTYTCKIEHRERIEVRLRRSLRKMAGKCKRFYQITESLTGTCDFGIRQQETERLLSDVNQASPGQTGSGITWKKMMKPIVACILPQRFCDEIGFHLRLTDLLTDPNTCNGFADSIIDGYKEADGDCLRNDIGMLEISATQCAAECTSTPNCEGWVYVVSGSQHWPHQPCYLKNPMCETPAPKEGFHITSYYKNLTTNNGCYVFNSNCACKDELESAMRDANCEFTMPEHCPSEPTSTIATPTTKMSTAAPITTLDMITTNSPSCINAADPPEGMCPPQDFNCHIDDPTERSDAINYIEQNCENCDYVPVKWHIFVSICSDVVITEAHINSTVTLVDTTQVKEKYYLQILRIVQAYAGNTKAVMKYQTAAKIISRERILGLTFDGLLPYVETLPDPKNLAFVRQTLAPLEIPEDKSTELRDSFDSVGCPFLSGISVKTLKQPSIISLQLAMDLCDCSEQQPISIPAKIDALCEEIHNRLYYGSSKDKFGDFMAIMDTLCPQCLVYSLNRIPDWKRMVLDNTQLRTSVCDKVGSSIALTTEDLMEWVEYCTVASGARGCTALRPSLMAYQPSLASPTDVATCKDVFCTRLCSLTLQELDTIRQALAKPYNDDVGCLTYLDDNIPMQEGPAVDSSTIPGSCPLRSRILKRAGDSRRGRRKRSTSCTGSCENVGVEISVDNISPPDVLDVTQIGTCASPVVFTCIKDNDLGEFRWDVEQARALLQLIRQSGTFDSLENYSSEDLQILGFIGVGFTPEELDNLHDLTDAVYEIFGVAHGWSPRQRRVLALRYLRDRNLQPQNLTSVHLAKLNHIVCGLLPGEVRDIPRQSVIGSTTFLGDLQRCEIGVLMELADHLKRHYGPVKQWVEDHFSEFGIILAGLRGEDLRSVGTDLSDHVTAPFINHIPPEEFRKLSPAQTRLFTYIVAQTISRRGLCPWLSDRHKQGNIRTACSNCTYLQPTAILVLLLAATTATFFGSSAGCAREVLPSN